MISCRLPCRCDVYGDADAAERAAATLRCFAYCFDARRHARFFSALMLLAATLRDGYASLPVSYFRRRRCFC